MKIDLPHNLKPKINLSGTSGKNLLKNGLVKPLYRFVKSVTKTYSEMQKLKIYNKTINNIIYRNRWRETIDEGL